MAFQEKMIVGFTCNGILYQVVTFGWKRDAAGMQWKNTQLSRDIRDWAITH